MDQLDSSDPVIPPKPFRTGDVFSFKSIGALGVTAYLAYPGDNGFPGHSEDLFYLVTIDEIADRINLIMNISHCLNPLLWRQGLELKFKGVFNRSGRVNRKATQRLRENGWLNETDKINFRLIDSIDFVVVEVTEI